MWIIQTEINGLRYWLQVKGIEASLNGLKDNATTYFTFSQALSAAAMHKNNFSTQLQVVEK